MKGTKALVLLALAALLVFAALAVTGCGSGTTDTTKKETAKTVKIALLLPETKTARYETQDKPLFEERVKELNPDIEILYSNANQDATEQQSQAEAALTNGANVLVLDPVDSASAASIVEKAAAQGVPVISYDRLILNADVDYYVSFDNEKVGNLQGQALLDKLTADGNAGKTIVMINGSPTDNNATLFKAGAHSVLDGKMEIGAEYDTPDWSPDKAQTEMDQAITKLGKDGFVGVYCANDGTCGGAIAAMKGAGIDPTKIPSTGQDAELAGIQRVLLGEQYMTVYKAIKAEAYAAAELAVGLADGSGVPSSMTLSNVANGFGDIPSVLLTPVAVTKDNIKDTVVADGFWSVEEILNTPELVTAGAAVGLTK
ncbi:MAG: sugar ABC transporter substrate-binding protein [Actinomycetota bacterium]|nr:sugar ABC transporter substrate-binding protein [Actinomycetota bacterium]